MVAGIRQFREQNWRDTGGVLHWGAVFLFSLCLGVAEGSFMRPAWAGFLVVFSLSFLGTALGLWLLEKLLMLLFCNGIREMLSWTLLCLLCVVVITWDAYSAGFRETAAFAVVFSVVFALLLKSLWAVGRHKVRTKAIYLTILFTAVPVVAFAVLLASDGFGDAYVEAYLRLAEEAEGRAGIREKESGKEAERDLAGTGGKRTAGEGLTEQERADFLESMQPGKYTAASVTYGLAGTADLPAGTTDISKFAQNRGLVGRVKEWYQGFSLEQAPVRGIVWYPQETSGCPTLFMIHGNHGWTTESYLGYGYLGEYLASHGYVVVSVDQNACNGLAGENDGRAVLLLENIRQVLAYNRQPGNLLYQKMDDERLALAGHSRGGEAIAAAYLFNEMEYYPDDGNNAFQYHFPIRSLVAIAPTCGQYRPSGRGVELEDVNYMVLHGANDQDVYTFMGMEQYEDIFFTGEKECLKTSLYVAGLNHGQFNSQWGKYDMVRPMNHMLNVGNFLAQEEQQQIAEVFIKAFLDQTLKGERQEGQDASGRQDKRESAAGHVPTDLLENCRKYRELLPETLYVQSYASSDIYVLCNFEEDARLDTGTAEGVSLQASAVRGWREEELDFSTGAARGNHAVILQGGEDGAALQLSFSDWEGSVEGWDESRFFLLFDIMDMREGFEEDEVELLEAEVEVRDASGLTARLPVSLYADIYPPFPVRLNKLQYLWGTAEYKHQFQTVSIPLADFEGIDLSRICQITLCFPGRYPKAAIDNIGIRKENQ